MRKLLLVLLAFIAIFTYIRALEKPETTELREISRETGTEFTINN